MKTFSGLDVAGICADYERQVRAICEGELPVALELSGRLDPAHWTLEWNIAAWVGEALLTDESILRQITLSNVLGLAAIVLFDDLEDGEVDLVGLKDAAPIAEALYQSFMAPYRALFDADSPFWAERDRLMAAWRRATSSASMRSGASPSRDAIAADLAARGAPLKISVTALCRLADSRRTLSQLDSCLDHALTAMVLYDHFVDWREDLDADRWNAFVEHACAWPAPQLGDARAPNRVEVAMVSSDAITTYFDSIRGELNAATGLAAAAGIGGLLDHLVRVEEELNAQGRNTAERYRALGRSAERLVFGGYPIQAA
jgi:hypothetical protein